MDDFLLKLIQSLGVPGLSVWLIYKLIDRFGTQFLIQLKLFVETTTRQSDSIGQVVERMQSAESRQKDVGIALRVQSAQITQLIDRNKELEALIMGLAKEIRTARATA